MKSSFKWILGSVLCASASTLIQAAEVANGPATDPVTVDGVASAPEYGGAGSIGYISGSLFRAALNDILLNSTITARVGADASDPNGDKDLYLLARFARRSTPFGTGEAVATFSIPLFINGTAYPNALVRLTNGSLGAQFVEVDLDGDGPGDFVPAGNFGIKGAFGFGTSFDLPNTHLVVELKLPLEIPKKYGRYFKTTGQTGSFKPTGALIHGFAAADGGIIGDQSETFVKVDGNGVTTFNDDTVPHMAKIDFKPNDNNNVNPGEMGNTQVGIITDSRVTASDVDWRTLKLQGTNMPSTTFARARKAMLKDLNGDGLLDLLVHFDLSTGAVNSSTTRIRVWGNLNDGSPMLGYDNIAVTG